MGYIKKINSYLEWMENKGCERIQTMYLLAEAAGMNRFNPFKATEDELEMLAENIGDLKDWE